MRVEAPEARVEATNHPSSTVYGPVRSWRVGMSLGVDLLFINSICSFRCLYCQLGKIEDHHAERRIFVSTEKVLRDLEASPWADADIITLSGSGEPTLALNMGEVIQAIKNRTSKPVMVLTNGTTLGDPAVIEELCAADRVAVKLDAPNDRLLKIINQPTPGVTVRSIVEGAKALRQRYRGHLAVQMMFLPFNKAQLEDFAGLLNEIEPDELQLNTPLRPVPREWFIEARGNHDRSVPYPAAPIKALSREEARSIEQELARLTGLPISSVYPPP